MGGRMDVHESKDKNEMMVVMELPSMHKEGMDIDRHNNWVIIAGQSVGGWKCTTGWQAGAWGTPHIRGMKGSQMRWAAG